VRFSETPLEGAFLVDIEYAEDERGFFARTFAREEFEAAGLDPDVSQCSTSWNPRRDTLRGMHYQREPHGECKLVRCTRGAVYAVAVDLRPDAETYCAWTAAELRADTRQAIYVPVGMAFGFQSLEDASELLYMMSHPFTPSHYAGVRWDDPTFGIDWPAADERIISDRDRSYPDFQP
jgi:dTDP-4-dehydrorhamnose 3,5-epimerase